MDNSMPWLNTQKSEKVFAVPFLKILHLHLKTKLLSSLLINYIDCGLSSAVLSRAQGCNFTSTIKPHSQQLYTMPSTVYKVTGWIVNTAAFCRHTINIIMIIWQEEECNISHTYLTLPSLVQQPLASKQQCPTNYSIHLHNNMSNYPFVCTYSLLPLQLRHRISSYWCAYFTGYNDNDIKWRKSLRFHSAMLWICETPHWRLVNIRVVSR